MIFFKKLREKSEEYGIPFWKLPEVLLISSAIVNVFVMIITYYWAGDLAEDPREAVFIVALEAIIILVISNMIVESANGIINNQKLKKEFIDIISHQIKSPLTNIRWSLEMLERKKNRGHEITDKYLHRVAESSEKIITLVNDFIHLSRMDEKSRLEKKKINLAKLSQKLIENNSFFAQSRNVTVEFEQANEEFFVNANEENLQIALENLIDNAIKYCPEGTSVKIFLERKEENVIFEISNKGIGISQEERPFMFNKFYRSDKAKLLFSNGTGLGLYISKNLLHKMNGDVWFESKPGEKTTFFVKLPKA